MKTKTLAALVAVAAAHLGCSTQYVGGCRLADDTCLEWYADGNSPDTAPLAAECAASGGGVFSTASCPSASRAGTCLFDSLVNGKRRVYYAPAWTTERARAHCDNLRGAAGSFVAANP